MTALDGTRPSPPPKRRRAWLSRAQALAETQRWAPLRDEADVARELARGVYLHSVVPLVLRIRVAVLPLEVQAEWNWRPVGSHE